MTVTAFVRHLKHGAAAAIVLAVGAPAEAALTFNFTFTGGTSVTAQNAFIAAGNRWANLFTDDVSIDLTVGTAALAPNILGQARSRQVNFGYNAFTAALAADITSPSDVTAVANLPFANNGPGFDLLINGTSDNPSGPASPAPYIDNDNGANNNSIWLTTANAKALGLNAGAGNVGGCIGNCDAFIQFNSNFAFDFDPDNGIGAGLYDFVGVATHEIGHALGFISGVDILDQNFGPFSDNAFTFVTSLDLFRYSSLSAANDVIDWTADNRAKYFSIDGGATAIAGFSTGISQGDGRQASHWKDGLGLGIMDPTVSTGELLAISDNDKLAFDVIGWNLARQQAPIPEPASWMMMIAGFGLAGHAMRRPRARTTVRFA